jgi:hypothetical protein
MAEKCETLRQDNESTGNVTHGHCRAMQARTGKEVRKSKTYEKKHKQNVTHRKRWLVTPLQRRLRTVRPQLNDGP